MTEEHAHDHPDFLAHHFDTPKQQFEAGKLGMWLFLATEILLFGALFVAYSVWRSNNPEMFKFGSDFLDTKMGAINTAVLITSSLTMAWGVTCAQRGQRNGLIICLVLTLMGAAGFMVIKYFEYTHKFHEGYYPGMRFYEQPGHHSETWNEQLVVPGTEDAVTNAADNPAPTAGDLGLPEDIIVEPPSIGPVAAAPGGANVALLAELDPQGAEEVKINALQRPDRPRNAHMFFNIYFMMTGLHGIHVVVGGVVIIWLLIGAIKGKFSKDYFTPVDLGGLYWHIVDLIWIFLFPLFYLI